jgi:2-dehydro-3-deoxy-D-arabinonate dehydratase
MVLVLGEDGLPIGYTLGNDLTAWDIERECPLYLNQAKIWDGASSVGPYIVPADVFGDPYDCQVECQVYRGDDCIIDSKGSTVELKRSLEELCYYLTYNNTVPSGTLLFTGTACVIPHDFALAEGDIVRVSVEGLGVLENPMKKLSSPPANFTTR